MATFTNQATLSYNNTVTSSNIVTGELIETLSVTKTALVDSYAGGDTLTYIVSILNAGATTFSNLTLTDDLGAYEFGTRTLVPLTFEEGSLRAFTNGVLSQTPTVTADPPLTISGLSVPAGGNLMLIYNATVNAFAPLGEEGSVTNTVSVSGPGIVTPVTASETVTTRDEALLTITKAISPVAVTDNQPITYTFTIQNFGNAPVTAEGNAVVTDLFDPILSDLSVTLNGVALSEGEGYNYNESTGLFTTVAGVITVEGATYIQNLETGEFTVVPGVSVLVVTGTV